MKKVIEKTIIVLLILCVVGLISVPILKDIKFGLDLKGGFEVLYQVKRSDGKKLKQNDMKSTYDVLKRNSLKTNEEISFNAAMPNYISFCPLNENKKFIDAEPIWIMPGLKHKYIWEGNEKKERKMEEEDV